MKTRFRLAVILDQYSYERQKFVYLVAVIAIALTEAARRDERFVAVVSHLRRIVRVEMNSPGLLLESRCRQFEAPFRPRKAW